MNKQLKINLALFFFMCLYRTRFDVSSMNSTLNCKVMRNLEQPLVASSYDPQNSLMTLKPAEMGSKVTQKKIQNIC